jgi:hypothetical protein
VQPHADVPIAGVALVGALIFAGAIVFGFRGITTAWPIASHPKFAVAASGSAIRIVVHDEVGTKVDLREAYPWMSSSHYNAMARHIDRSSPSKQAKMLQDIWSDTDGRLLPGARSITFIREQLRLRPDGRAVKVGSDVLVTIRP